jgi:proteasome beta subunit
MAYGVLEDRYTKNISEDEAVALAVRAIRSAMKRDAGSGEGIHVVVITKEANRELPESEIAGLTPVSPA